MLKMRPSCWTAVPLVRPRHSAGPVDFESARASEVLWITFGVFPAERARVRARGHCGADRSPLPATTLAWNLRLCANSRRLSGTPCDRSRALATHVCRALTAARRILAEKSIARSRHGRRLFRHGCAPGWRWSNRGPPGRVETSRFTPRTVRSCGTCSRGCRSRSTGCTRISGHRDVALFRGSCRHDATAPAAYDLEDIQAPLSAQPVGRG